MHDTGGVGSGERIGELDGDLQGLLIRMPLRGISVSSVLPATSPWE